MAYEKLISVNIGKYLLKLNSETKVSDWTFTDSRQPGSECAVVYIYVWDMMQLFYLALYIQYMQLATTVDSNAGVYKQLLFVQTPLQRLICSWYRQWVINQMFECSDPAFRSHPFIESTDSLIYTVLLYCAIIVFLIWILAETDI